MSSPVFIDGHVYHFGRYKHFYCIEPKTGEVRWKSEKKFGEYWSMVAHGKQILALDQNGELLLINANPEKLDIVGRTKVSDNETWAHLAVCGNEVFVRDLKGVTAWDWQAP